MKSLIKILVFGWIVVAICNILVFFFGGHDFDKLMIAALELLLAAEDYNDLKEMS